MLRHSQALARPGAGGDESPGPLDVDEDETKEEDRGRKASLEKEITRPERGS